jgi:hypothetical protein
VPAAENLSQLAKLTADRACEGDGRRTYGTRVGPEWQQLAVDDLCGSGVVKPLDENDKLSEYRYPGRVLGRKRQQLTERVIAGACLPRTTARWMPCA